jgi:SAM-dependent methyltransferase
MNATDKPAGVVGFEALARDYDRAFGAAGIGARLRARAWERLDALFAPGQHVLELNCGTGEDALRLARRGVRVTATDGSPAMLAEARRKIEAAGAGDRIDTQVLPIESIRALDGRGPFDGAISNFGGLNCVADLAQVARDLAGFVRPGGMLALGVMGPLAAWEWAWFPAHGQPERAFRRLARGGAPWRGMTIRYPSAPRLRGLFQPWFQTRRISALGALVPGTYAEAWAARHPRALAALDRMDRAVAALPLAWLLADHYLIEMVRRPEHR